MAVYLDCNATTPLEPRVLEAMKPYFEEEFGNAASRTHEYGRKAKEACELARRQVAEVVDAEPSEVIFTSGATESNNIAILGLEAEARRTGHKHIISSQIEHKAVLEPLQVLEARGFQVTLLPPNRRGVVEAESVARALRPETILVSIMHVNNETGIIQPITEIATSLERHSAYLHTDAAQGFGKRLEDLQTPRIDMISLSGHKIYGPKGVGGLITRRRRFARPPLEPLMHGGGHELGLRPGTLPIPLIVGLGKAARMSLQNQSNRTASCLSLRSRLLDALHPFNPRFNGDPNRAIGHVLNLSFPGVDSEAAILSLKGVIAISNGSACTSAQYASSHVLKAMMIPEDRIRGALRFSWCHLTSAPDVVAVQSAIASLMGT